MKYFCCSSRRRIANFKVPHRNMKLRIECPFSGCSTRRHSNFLRRNQLWRGDNHAEYGQREGIAKKRESDCSFTIFPVPNETPACGENADEKEKEEGAGISGAGADSSGFEWQLEQRDYYLPAFAPSPLSSGPLSFLPRPFLRDENGQTSLEITSSRASKCSRLLRGSLLVVRPSGCQEKGERAGKGGSSVEQPPPRYYFYVFRHQSSFEPRSTPTPIPRSSSI